jgi:hypothetical protein
VSEIAGMVVYFCLLGLLGAVVALGVAWVVGWCVSKIIHSVYPRRLYHVLAVLLALVPFSSALLMLPSFLRMMDSPSSNDLPAWFGFYPLQLCATIVVLVLVAATVIIDARRARCNDDPH